MLDLSNSALTGQRVNLTVQAALPCHAGRAEAGSDAGSLPAAWSQGLGPNLTHLLLG